MRFIGWIFVALGLAALGYDLWPAVFGEAEFRGSVLGELAFKLFPQSFPILQPAIERHISPALWDPWVLTLLLWPAWAVFLVPGAVLLVLFRRRRRRRR